MDLIVDASEFSMGCMQGASFKEDTATVCSASLEDMIYNVELIYRAAAGYTGNYFLVTIFSDYLL